MLIQHPFIVTFRMKFIDSLLIPFLEYFWLFIRYVIQAIVTTFTMSAFLRLTQIYVSNFLP